MKITEACTYLLEKAKAMKIELEVLAMSSRELSLEAFRGELSQMTQATQGGLGLRAVIDGKVGYASTEERSQEALDWALQEAKENAELQNKSNGFLVKGQNLGRKDLLDEGLSAPLDKKMQCAIDLEENLRKDSRCKEVSIARYSENESELEIGSTSGVEGGYRNGYSFLLSSLIMEDQGSQKQSFGVDISNGFHALDPGRTALQIIEETGRLLGSRPLQTGRYTAYFEPKAVTQLMGLLLFMVNGKSVIEGKSRLAKRLGEQVATQLFTLVDDPFLDKGLQNRPFDSEGTPSKTIQVIENGILKSFLHNSETAQALGQENTAHASRSYKGILDVGPSNLFIQPGGGIKLDQGIIVTDFMGMHAGANPISGDLSLQSFGLVIEGGEVSHPVENFAVSGNILDMLMNIQAVGRELEWHASWSILGAPMLEVADVSFAGA